MTDVSRLRLGLGLAIVSGLLALWRPAPLDAMDLRVFAALVRADTTAPAPTRTAVVPVAETSRAALGQWPWPRDVLASLVNRLHDLGAASVALDVLLAEPERMAGPGEARLAEALARQPSVVGHSFVFEPTATAVCCVLKPLALVERAVGDRSATAGLPAASGAICTRPDLATAAGAGGFINVATDPDGLLRRVPLLLSLGAAVHPGLALAAAHRATGAGPVVLDVDGDGSLELSLGARTVALDRRGASLRRAGRWPDSGRGRDRGRVPRAAIADRVVFVGATAAGLRDVVATAQDRQVPRQIHAAVAEVLLGAPGYARPGGPASPRSLGARRRAC